MPESIQQSLKTYINKTCLNTKTYLVTTNIILLPLDKLASTQINQSIESQWKSSPREKDTSNRYKKKIVFNKNFKIKILFLKMFF
jgi:hypothetical protein